MAYVLLLCLWSSLGQVKRPWQLVATQILPYASSGGPGLHLSKHLFPRPLAGPVTSSDVFCGAELVHAYRPGGLTPAQCIRVTKISPL